jgi:phage recombination protein Bet
MGAVTILANDRDVQLVRNTVAKDLLPSELDLFIHMCRQWRLDPLRRQIYAQVYKRKKKDGKQWIETRNVVYVTGIDGYRSIADRTGNYRPGQRTADTSPEARNAKTNPQGIVSATAEVWKFAHGEWHSFSETVYWEEFAPLKERWEKDETGEGRPTGDFALDTSGQWGRMGRVMLQKCAEAQALRRGWPDEYGDLYVAEEMDQAKIIDITPSEQAERAESEQRFSLIGGKSALTIDWCDGGELQRVPSGQFGDRALAFIHSNKDEPISVLTWADRNRHALKEYWALDKSGALAIKKELEPFEAMKPRAAE